MAGIKSLRSSMRSMRISPSRIFLARDKRRSNPGGRHTGYGIDGIIAEINRALLAFKAVVIQETGDVFIGFAPILGLG